MGVRSSHAVIPRYTPCGYCFEEFARVWDHIIPWSRGGRTTASNLMPSCRLCNSLLSDFVFDSIEDRRSFVTERRKKRLQPREYKRETANIRKSLIKQGCPNGRTYRDLLPQAQDGRILGLINEDSLYLNEQLFRQVTQGTK